jgi:hypothetical protein
MRVRIGLVIACLGFASVTLARTPHDLDTIQREARIAEDVFESVLRTEWRDSLRVSSVDAQFLANQGVLMSIRISKPWISIREDGSNIEIDGPINIPEIPRIVEDILDKLEIDFVPYEPAALEDLRELRAEQRELRLEQREIRADLRVKRRDLVRADDDSEREDIKTDIESLEREVAAVDAQYEALRDDIESQMELIGELNRRPQTVVPEDSGADLETSIAQIVCDYGATLKSLDSDHYLTLVVRSGEAANRFVFKMDHVRQCSNDGMKPERLLELGYQY